jgi:hypothetical protein
MFNIKAVRYPNNEIRISRGQDRMSSYSLKPDREGEVPCEILACDDYFEWEESKKKSPPLSLVPNSKTERSTTGYGSLPVKPTIFGLNAKRQLIRSGAAMEKTVNPFECLFLTGTLPGSTEGAFSAIAAYSGYIVNSLKAWVSNYVSSKLDFYCWEYQKRGALHLHYCVHVPDQCDRDFIVGNFKNWWISVLSRVGERSNTDLFRKNSGKTHLSDTSKVRAVAEVVRKSVARYLAKYLSKSVSPARGTGRFFTPSRWWGTSRPLKSLLESMTDEIDIIEGPYFQVIKRWEDVKAVVDTSESVTYSYPHKFGMGHTSVCYPADQSEDEALWEKLVSMGSMMRMSLSKQTIIPSQDLRALRGEIHSSLSESLVNLSDSFQGLRASVEGYLNFMMKLTPSTSEQPLSILLNWAARTSDFRSLLPFTPIGTKSNLKMIDRLLDVLEVSIELVAQKGWY